MFICISFKCLKCQIGGTLKSLLRSLTFFLSLHPSFLLSSRSQFPVLSQSSGSSNLGDSSSESGGDVKASELCHRPLLFVSSGPPSLHNGNPAQGTYHQPSSPSTRHHNPQHHHHHHHHPYHLINSHHSHHHHQLQASQVISQELIPMC